MSEWNDALDEAIKLCAEESADATRLIVKAHLRSHDDEAEALREVKRTADGLAAAIASLKRTP